MDNFPRWTQGWNHDQQFLQIGDQEARIDKDIVFLIDKIWRKGIRTTGSCQDRPLFPQDDERVWISFETSFNAERFLELLSKGVEINEDLTFRIRHPHFNPLDELTSVEERQKAWYLGATPLDLGISVENKEEGVTVENRIGEAKFSIEIDVFFPMTDKEEIERRLERFI